MPSKPDNPGEVSPERQTLSVNEEDMRWHCARRAPCLSRRTDSRDGRQELLGRFSEVSFDGSREISISEIPRLSFLNADPLYRDQHNLSQHRQLRARRQVLHVTPAQLAHAPDGLLLRPIAGVAGGCGKGPPPEFEIGDLKAEDKLVNRRAEGRTVKSRAQIFVKGTQRHFPTARLAPVGRRPRVSKLMTDKQDFLCRSHFRPEFHRHMSAVRPLRTGYRRPCRCCVPRRWQPRDGAERC